MLYLRVRPNTSIFVQVIQSSITEADTPLGDTLESVMISKTFKSVLAAAAIAVPVGMLAVTDASAFGGHSGGGGGHFGGGGFGGGHFGGGGFGGGHPGGGFGGGHPGGGGFGGGHQGGFGGGHQGGGFGGGGFGGRRFGGGYGGYSYGPSSVVYVRSGCDYGFHYSNSWSRCIPND